MLDVLKHYTMDKGYADILEKDGWTWNFTPNFAGVEMYDISTPAPLGTVSFCIDMSDTRSFGEQMQVWTNRYDYKREAKEIRSWYKDKPLKECRVSAKCVYDKLVELTADLKQYENEVA